MIKSYLKFEHDGHTILTNLFGRVLYIATNDSEYTKVPYKMHVNKTIKSVWIKTSISKEDFILEIL